MGIKTKKHLGKLVHRVACALPQAESELLTACANDKGQGSAPGSAKLVWVWLSVGYPLGSWGIIFIIRTKAHWHSQLEIQRVHTNTKVQQIAASIAISASPIVIFSALTTGPQSQCGTHFGYGSPSFCICTDSVVLSWWNCMGPYVDVSHVLMRNASTTACITMHLR